MTPREELSEINKRIGFRRTKIQEHYHEIAYHQYHIECQRKSIEILEGEKKHFFNDSDLEPYALMTPAQQARINKMPVWDKPCEFCESTEVKKGKDMIVCLRCGHNNMPKKVHTPIKSEDTK